MKVLICPGSLYFSDSHPAGETQIAYGFARELVAMGHTVIVFSPKVNLRKRVEGLLTKALGPLYGQMPGSGSYAGEKLLWWEFSLRALDEARRLLRTERIDVIHHLLPSHEGKWSLLARLGVPLVYGPLLCTWAFETGREGPAKERPLREKVGAKLMDRLDMHLGTRLWKRTLESSRALIASTEAARESIGLEHSDRCVLLPFGVDTNVFHPNGDGAGGQPVILYLGLLAKRKGIFDLLHAFSIVKRELGAKLVVVGGGEIEAVGARARELGIGDRVEIKGEIPHEEVARYMRGCTLFCLPSHGEPFGLVLLQAMASAKPIVATRGGGVAEIVTDGRSGILVGQKRPAELACAIERLLTDPAEQRRMGAFNRQRAEREFDWRVVTGRLVSIYERAIGG